MTIKRCVNGKDTKNKQGRKVTKTDPNRRNVDFLKKIIRKTSPILLLFKKTKNRQTL